ncbi:MULTISPECIES: cupin domain-containing protein [Microbacteriaceae]|uniref:cupin domain-containing protein n=1 Tax=Microbacteriaceae TaxID=85023 RepID=UPI00035D222A|nr:MULTISPECIES: cupin domain-containing protein [Microbacteriaceae]TDP98833.1 mannose-6-phosphate isomerase-like protein (cupin superfamily) [Leifsonia sp. 115AMFTsu3.1]
MNTVHNLDAAFALIPEPWQPHRLASVNDYDVKVARLRGEFVWHAHPETDELFLVIEGRLTIQLSDGDVELGPHDVFVVPRGVEHCPKADEDALVVMVEPKGTVNTGDRPGERTAELRELADEV